MVCASAIWLCVYAVGVAEVGLAARRQGTTEQMSSAVNELIGALGGLAKAGGGKHAVTYTKMIDRLTATPGATDSLNDALKDLVAELEANVDTKIQAGFRDTQTAIEQSINELTQATASAVESKGSADASDSDWVSCVGDEKSKLEAVEAAEVALAQAEESTVVPCQQEKDREPFAFTPSIDTKVTCDFSVEGDCDTQVASYSDQVNQMVSSLKDDVSESQASWQEAKDMCAAANADVAQKEASLQEATQAWENQKFLCLEAHESRSLALCAFGTKLQAKCSSLAAYSALIAEVDSVDGGVHSQPDRESEWHTTQVTKCLMSQVIEGADINLAECEGAVNFAQDVGELDRMEVELAEQTKPASFTCAEQTITFSGQTWEIPQGATPHSSEYKMVEYHPPVNVMDPPAFTFCGASDGPGKP